MSVVVLFVELVEGTDKTTARRNPDFKAYCGATGGLMMRMIKPPFGTGGAVVVDSGFFVLKVLIGMLAHGVYGTTVIKNKDIGPSTAREIPLSSSFNTKRLGIFMFFW